MLRRSVLKVMAVIFAAPAVVSMPSLYGQQKRERESHNMITIPAKELSDKHVGMFVVLWRKEQKIPARINKINSENRLIEWEFSDSKEKWKSRYDTSGNDIVLYSHAEDAIRNSKLH